MQKDLNENNIYTLNDFSFQLKMEKFPELQRQEEKFILRFFH